MVFLAYVGHKEGSVFSRPCYIQLKVPYSLFEEVVHWGVYDQGRVMALKLTLEGHHTPFKE